MNNNYLKIIDKIELLKEEIENLSRSAEHKTYEDKEAYHIVENLADQLDTIVYKLKRLSWPAIEGKLQEDPERGKFELIRNDTGRGIGWQLSCGSYLEVYDEDTGEWYPGRVEHTTKNGCTGYYFVNGELDSPFLYTGMHVRIRREE